MSPLLTEGESYDRWAGHFDDLDPKPADLDATLRKAAHAFATATPAERADFTAALDMHDSYALQSFSYRAAILGLRVRDPELVRDGLAAATALDPHVIDYRDAGHTVPFLYYCMLRLGMNAKMELDEALGRALPSMANAMVHAVRRYATYHSLKQFRKHELLAVEVRTASGVGIVNLGTSPFQPRLDLVGLVLQIAALVRADSQYQLDRVACAEDLPWYWLFGTNSPDTAREELKRSVLGACEVRADLRPHVTETKSRYGNFTQKLWIMVAETKDALTAAQLSVMAEEAVRPRGAIVGVSNDRLCGIIIAFFAVDDLRLFETRQSLERFQTPLAQLLATTPPLSGQDPFERSGEPVGDLFI